MHAPYRLRARASTLRSNQRRISHRCAEDAITSLDISQQSKVGKSLQRCSALASQTMHPGQAKPRQPLFLPISETLSCPAHLIQPLQICRAHLPAMCVKPHQPELPARWRRLIPPEHLGRASAVAAGRGARSAMIDLRARRLASTTSTRQTAESKEPPACRAMTTDIVSTCGSRATLAGSSTNPELGPRTVRTCQRALWAIGGSTSEKAGPLPAVGLREVAIR